MASASQAVFKNPKEGQKLASATSRFALALYLDRAAAGTGNIFLSPISIHMALAMTYLGARGNTKDQMKKGMFIEDIKEEELHQVFSDVREALKGKEGQYQLAVANRLFGQKTYNFLKEYLAASSKYYGAELAPVDFV